MGLAAVAGFTPEELRELASVDVRTVDIDTLTDLRDIQIGRKEAGVFCKAGRESICGQDRRLCGEGMLPERGSHHR